MRVAIVVVAFAIGCSSSAKKPDDSWDRSWKAMRECLVGAPGSSDLAESIAMHWLAEHHDCNVTTLPRVPARPALDAAIGAMVEAFTPKPMDPHVYDAPPWGPPGAVPTAKLVAAIDAALGTPPPTGAKRVSAPQLVPLVLDGKPVRELWEPERTSRTGLFTTGHLEDDTKAVVEVRLVAGAAPRVSKTWATSPDDPTFRVEDSETDPVIAIAGTAKDGVVVRQLGDQLVVERRGIPAQSYPTKSATAQVDASTGFTIVAWSGHAMRLDDRVMHPFGDSPFCLDRDGMWFGRSYWKLDAAAPTEIIVPRDDLWGCSQDGAMFHEVRTFTGATAFTLCTAKGCEVAKHADLAIATANGPLVVEYEGPVFVVRWQGKSAYYAMPEDDMALYRAGAITDGKTLDIIGTIAKNATIVRVAL